MASNKKSVLIVARWPVGGIRTFVRYVYSNFSPEKYKLTLISPDLNEARMMLSDLNKFELKSIFIDSSPTIFQFFKAVSKSIIRSNFDLIHSQGHTAAAVSSLAAFVTSTPHLFTSHDMFNSKQFHGIRGKIVKFFLSTTLLFPNTIHLVSYDAYNNLKVNLPLIGILKKKCVIIPHGIDTDRFLTANARNLRKEFGIHKDTLLIGFLGRFMSPKGFQHLIEAVEIIKNRHKGDKNFLVMAFGAGGFIREEKETIEKKNLSECFMFLPFVDDVASTLKGLDMVVMPSLWEACGMLAMETLVSGIPLIASKCIGLREVTEGTPAKKVRVRDNHALANAIIEEMSCPSKVNALDYVDEASVRFSVRRRIEDIETCIENLILRN